MAQHVLVTPLLTPCHSKTANQNASKPVYTQQNYVHLLHRALRVAWYKIIIQTLGVVYTMEQ